MKLSSTFIWRPEYLLLFCFDFDGGGKREGRSFPVGKKKKKNTFKGLFAECGPCPHIVFLLNYLRWFALFVSSWSFAKLPNTRLRVESIIDHSSCRFSKMVIVNTQIYNLCRNCAVRLQYGLLPLVYMPKKILIDSG